VTQPTSSSSAPSTTEEPGQAPTGKPATDRSNAITSKDELLADLMSKRQVKKMSDWDFYWWDLRARFRHRFRGQHTLIPHEYWSRDEDGELKVTERGWKCWRCEYTEQ